MAVHLKIKPHSGNTAMLREVAQMMFVTPSPSTAVQKVRMDCTRYQKMINKTLELDMAVHHFPRTMIAPLFYNALIEVAFGFPGQPFKPAQETHNVTAALEQQSARDEIPAHVFIDCGTQRKALHYVSIKIRDQQFQMSEPMGMDVSVSELKSYEEGCRVELKIRILRESLQRLTATPKSMETRLWLYEQKAADTDEDWPNLSWRGQIPESMVSSSRKESMNDLRAVEFKRSFARGEVVPSVSVALVQSAEHNEGDPCEPTAKGGNGLGGLARCPLQLSLYPGGRQRKTTCMTCKLIYAVMSCNTSHSGSCPYGKFLSSPPPEC